MTGDGRFGFPLALDADAGGTTARAGRDEPRSPLPRAPARRSPPATPRGRSGTAIIRADDALEERRASARAPTPDSRRRPSRHAVEAGRCATARAEWPGFRGPDRDGVVRGVRDRDRLVASRRRSSCGGGRSARAGRRSPCTAICLHAGAARRRRDRRRATTSTTGEPVWRHRDAARFYESNGGAGPRGTPTLSNGRVYTLGATGIVNALDAGTGAVVWSRNAATDTGAKMPGWGFAELAARRRRPRRRRRVGPARRLRRSPPASRAGSARTAAAATARRSW